MLLFSAAVVKRCLTSCNSAVCTVLMQLYACNAASSPAWRHRPPYGHCHRVDAHASAVPENQLEALRQRQRRQRATCTGILQRWTTQGRSSAPQEGTYAVCQWHLVKLTAAVAAVDKLEPTQCNRRSWLCTYLRGRPLEAVLCCVAHLLLCYILVHADWAGGWLPARHGHVTQRRVARGAHGPPHRQRPCPGPA